MGSRVLLLPVMLAAWAAGATTNGPAKPEALNIESLPNAYRVTADYYRGAQPLPAGFAELEKLGVKTVIGLRAFHTDEPFLEGTTLAYVSIPMKTWHAEEEDFVKFLQVVTDTNRTPVFVHCQHGADRTGVMSAVYRMAVCGWARGAAVKEMTDGGFGFHSVWKNLVEFMNEVDVGKLKQQAGLKEAPSP